MLPEDEGGYSNNRDVCVIFSNVSEAAGYLHLHCINNETSKCRKAIQEILLKMEKRD